MKKIKNIILLVACVLGFMIIEPKTNAVASYKNDLDVIDKYEIHAHMEDDGSVRLKYDIKWTVLDDVREGPLEWVKIGIPNKHVSEITKLSDNIKKIRYYKDSGDYVRLDLNRKYYKGETINFSFSIRSYNI